MLRENKAAVDNIINHINTMFSSETSEQYIFSIGRLLNEEGAAETVEDHILIRIVRYLLEREIFLPAEVIEVDEDDIEDDMLYVEKKRSLGTLNKLLRGTVVRVIQTDMSAQIVKIALVV